MTYTEADESQRHDEMMYTAAEKQKSKDAGENAWERRPHLHIEKGIKGI